MINKTRLKHYLLVWTIVTLFLTMGFSGCEKPKGQQSADAPDGETQPSTDHNNSGDDDSNTSADDSSTSTEQSSGGKDKDTDWPKSEETDTCANLDIELSRQPSTIMMVVDHSASMTLPMGDSDTRWSVMVKTLMGTTAHPEQGLVWSLEDDVNFGLVLFTAKRNQPETCPILQTVSPALLNGDDIAALFKADDETYMGASPVPAGLAEATALLTAMKSTGKKVMLLATDGDPNTCDNLAVPGDENARNATIKAVQTAYDAGISTFIVGMENEENADAGAYLQKVANAGVGLDPEGTEKAPFHQGLTESSLVEAITEIITEEAQSCVYELNGKAIEGEESSGKVSLDGTPLELNNAEYGWRLKSPTEIELLGGACTDIQIGDHHLEAKFPCEAIVIILE